MTISDDNTNQDSTETILEKYRLLESIYSSLYADEGLSKSSRSAMPSYLRSLLPVSDGWCFSPLWEAPRPVEHWSGEFLNGSDFDAVSLPPQISKVLTGIEEKIVRRATSYRLIFHAMSLVENAIDNGRTLMGTTETQPRRCIEAIALEAFREAFREEQSRVAQDDKLTEATWSNIERLRLDWLIGWRDLVAPTVRGMRRRFGIYSKSYQVQYSIGIDQINQAHSLFIETAEVHSVQPTDLLGRWYQLMLLRCAATEGELERIWRIHWAGARRRAPKVITRDRVWGRVALKRLTNHINYYDSKSEASCQ